MKVDAGMSERFAARVRRLRSEFIETFPARLCTLSGLGGELTGVGADLDRLVRVRAEVHQLKGAAGMYQLDAVYQAACVAEAELDRALEAIAGQRTPDVDPAVILAPLLETLTREGS